MRHFIVLALSGIIFLMSSCQVGRYVLYNFADVRDYRKFPFRSLPASDKPFSFPIANNGQYPKTISAGKDTQQMDLATFLQKNATLAFLIIYRDTIQYERYFRGYKPNSVVPSFSMAKSVISILIGCAIEDGFIGSVDDSIGQYIPEAKALRGIKIKHLLQMTSGIAFNEGYRNPFGDVAAFYYGRQIRKKSLALKVKYPPGQKFKYHSGNTQLLGIVLESALKGKTITAYLGEKLWQPLGMEYPVSWSLDRKKDGIEKTFCCLNACARDYAKIGRLYLQKGNWQGRQIVSEQWVRLSTKIDTTEGSPWYYKYHWWINTPQGDFMARGLLGQYIYVNPAKKLVIVRLGSKEGKTDWRRFFVELAKEYN